MTTTAQPATTAAPGFKGNDRLLTGIVLGVLTFWMFAGTVGTVARSILSDINGGPIDKVAAPLISLDQMNLAVSVTALFSGLFIVFAGGLADRVGRVRITLVGNGLGIHEPAVRADRAARGDPRHALGADDAGDESGTRSTGRRSALREGPPLGVTGGSVSRRRWCGHPVGQQHRDPQLLATRPHDVGRGDDPEVAEHPVSSPYREGGPGVGRQPHPADGQRGAPQPDLAAWTDDDVVRAGILGHPLGPVGSEDLGDGSGDLPAALVRPGVGGDVEEVGQALEVAVAAEGRGLLAASPQRDLRDREADEDEGRRHLDVVPVGNGERVVGRGEEEVEAGRGGEGGQHAGNPVTGRSSRHDGEDEEHRRGARAHAVPGQAEHGGGNHGHAQGGPAHGAPVLGGPRTGHGSSEPPATGRAVGSPRS